MLFETIQAFKKGEFYASGHKALHLCLTCVAQYMLYFFFNLNVIFVHQTLNK